MVDLFVDPISWLHFEFPTGVERDCPASMCRVQAATAAAGTHEPAPPAAAAGGGQEDDHAAWAVAGDPDVAAAAALDRPVALTAYLTSYGGRPNPVALPPPRAGHTNAVCFMENDARLFGLGHLEGRRAGLAADVARHFGPRLGLGLGYRPAPPWGGHDPRTGGGQRAAAQGNTVAERGPGEERAAAAAAGAAAAGAAAGAGRAINASLPVPWVRTSYLNDPLERFLEWPFHGAFHRGLPGSSSSFPAPSREGSPRRPPLLGVVFFSSQCDGALAAARMRVVGALVPALERHGVPLYSFGKCFPTGHKLEEELPHCANLPR